ncbi:MAG: TIGR03857 family LLM class F420-dependent oxidoreductase [Solirubrobacteraceae bacterium]
MSATAQIATDADTLAPVVNDMSAFIISGALKSHKLDSPYETVGRTPALGVDDGVLAEKLGFRRVWLSERMDIKQADVILSGIGALTSRIELATGVLPIASRNPVLLAALGSTMHSCYGPRFVLGLGRSEPGYLNGTGMGKVTFAIMGDCIDIVRKLWRGEAVTYNGPLGQLDNMVLAETYQGDPPEIWLGGFALPKGAEFAARHCDGVLLVPSLVPDAVHAAVERLRMACERIDRDPATLRVCALAVTAPDLDEFEMRTIAHGRMVTYLTYSNYSDTLVEVNGWDRKVLAAVRNHEMFKNLDRVPDMVFHRHQMLDAAACIPDEYMLNCSALGTIDECVKSLQRFRDAGADEVVTYGSTPAQNAGLIAAWRERRPS